LIPVPLVVFIYYSKLNSIIDLSLVTSICVITWTILQVIWVEIYITRVIEDNDMPALRSGTGQYLIASFDYFGQFTCD